MGPAVTWMDASLGVVCLLVGGGYLALLAGRRAPVLPAAAHVVMGFGMAMMFLPALDPVPQTVWVALFVVSGSWFGAEALRAGALDGVAGPHVVGAAAMLFMLLGGHDHDAVPAGPVDPQHAHHAASGTSGGLLVTALALVFAAWYATDLVRLATQRAAATPVVATPVVAAPVAATAGSVSAVVTGSGPVAMATRIDPRAVAHVVMSVAMLVMLLGMA